VKTEEKGVKDLADFQFGWWTTGRDQAAVNLFDTVWHAISDGTIRGRMSYVFCSRQEGEGRYSDEIMALAAKRGIAVESLSAVEYRPELRKADRAQWRDLYHQQVYELIGKYQCPLAVLAGYMWVLSPAICKRINAINLHPALPGGPAGTWQEVIWQLLANRAQETGAMMHLVTPELDKGPAVTFFSFPITGNGWDALWNEFLDLVNERGMDQVMKEPGERLRLFEKIRHQGEIRELPLIVQTLRAFSERDICLEDGRLLDADGRPLSKPIDLSEQVNRSIGMD